ncbi:MAG: DAK2 domain-containing protein [Actinomycetes bacterium]
MSNQDNSLSRFRTVVAAALIELDSRREEINDLNVFPVADGDTGDNMVRTLQSVVTELDRLIEKQGEGSLDSVGRAEIVDAVTNAALLGGRGNSGVILSQLIHGAAEVMIDDDKPVDALMLAQAMNRASEQARRSVTEPREGTILTVMDDMAKRLLALVDEGTPALPDDVDEATQNAALATSLEAAVSEGDASVRRGPELLPELNEFGVTADAGGYGLVVIFAGIVAALKDGVAPEVHRHTAPREKPRPASHASSTFQYCVNFAVVGEGLDREAFIPELEQLGDSLMVVGSRTGSVLRVHVHSNDRAAVEALFDGKGEIRDIEVADMFAQIDARTRRLRDARSLVLAVVAGESMKTLFELDTSVVVLDGGTSLNPSTEEILDAIHAAPVEEIVILTGSANVTPAADKAAELSGRVVEVVETASVQEGLAVLHHHYTASSAAENAVSLRGALAAVTGAGVAPAEKDDPQGRYVTGDAVGFVGGELVSWGKAEAALNGVLAALPAEAEIVTLIEGSGSPFGDTLKGTVEARFPEVEHLRADHPGWWLLLTVE